MPTESGIVVGVDREGQIAIVKAAQNAACKSCSAGDSCNAADKREMEVRALNPVGAKAGDSVVINFETGSLLKATFVLYLVPILFLMMGAFGGQQLAAHFQTDPSSTAAVLGGLLFFLSLLGVRWWANRAATKRRYQPTVLRVEKVPSKTMNCSVR